MPMGIEPMEQWMDGWDNNVSGLTLHYHNQLQDFLYHQEKSPE